jgi:hypothetical protein
MEVFKDTLRVKGPCMTSESVNAVKKVIVTPDSHAISIMKKVASSLCLFLLDEKGRNLVKGDGEFDVDYNALDGVDTGQIVFL